MASRRLPIYFEAKTILEEIVKELGGTKPIYNNITISHAAIDYEVSFKIPKRTDTYSVLELSDDDVSNTEEGINYEETNMVEMNVWGSTDDMALYEEMKPASHYNLNCYDGAESYAMEIAAHEALQSLRDDHDVVAIDYNWYEAEEIRVNSGQLVYKILQGRNMYAYASLQCKDVINDQQSMSDQLLKQCSISDPYIIQLQKIHSDSLYALKECNSEAYGLEWKIDMLGVSCGLKIVLERLADRLGFNKSVLVVDKMSDGKYRGSVNLSKGDSYEQSVQGASEKSYTNAENNALFQSISFLSRQNNIIIMDASYFVLKDMRKSRNAIITEMLHLTGKAQHIFNIGSYIQNEIKRLKDEILGLTNKSSDDLLIVKVLSIMEEGLQEHLKRVATIQEVAWKNWADAS
ncbi:hypothetical protein EJB05_10119 [Eragrostis curvula]|uniref:Uncharacterized protein n=1 Tax=Eragrostis curvula TaxID=38414 RepID=A0A5J9W6T4_9POAL|nr:hypothetical protein EJB05_10119 [Eragrostis curvula]